MSLGDDVLDLQMLAVFGIFGHSGQHSYALSDLYLPCRLRTVQSNGHAGVGLQQQAPARRRGGRRAGADNCNNLTAQLQDHSTERGVKACHGLRRKVSDGIKLLTSSQITTDR